MSNVCKWPEFLNNTVIMCMAIANLQGSFFFLSGDERNDDTDGSLSQCKVNNTLWSCSCLLLASPWNLVF